MPLLFNFASEYANRKAHEDYEIETEWDISGEHAVTQLVEALCYKPEGRRFDS
jgi:hypothetical protein